MGFLEKVTRGVCSSLPVTPALGHEGLQGLLQKSLMWGNEGRPARGQEPTLPHPHLHALQPGVNVEALSAEEDVHQGTVRQPGGESTRRRARSHFADAR
jgi:hypothetical protein